MTQVHQGVETSLDSLRQKIDESLEQMIASRIDSGEVVELSGKVLLAGGKRLRPIMMCLSYQIAGGDDLTEIMPLAMAFEFLHTATLVHDDINDAAKQRRGITTLHERAGQAKAIIAGDWLFVHGFGLGGLYTKSIIDLVTDCCANIAISEFMQLDHVLNLSTSPEDYLQIVRGKTAGPFAAGCEAAALVAGSSQEDAEALGRFGMELGIAFQLMDDVLDLQGDERMGKPRGADVIEGKMTLPLIHALTLLHGEKRKKLSHILQQFTDKNWDELMGLLETSDSLGYSQLLVKTHLERATLELQRFPDSLSKSLLMRIVEHVHERHM